MRKAVVELPALKRRRHAPSANSADASQATLVNSPYKSQVMSTQRDEDGAPEDYRAMPEPPEPYARVTKVEPVNQKSPLSPDKDAP